LGFADPRVSYTRAFARYVLELSRRMTIQDVAEHLQVSWDLVNSTVRGLASNLSHTVQATSGEREFPGGLVDGTTF